VIWRAARSPHQAAGHGPEALRHRAFTGGNILPALAAYKRLPGMEGATYYYYDIRRTR